MLLLVRIAPLLALGLALAAPAGAEDEVSAKANGEAMAAADSEVEVSFADGGEAVAAADSEVEVSFADGDEAVAATDSEVEVSFGQDDGVVPGAAAPVLAPPPEVERRPWLAALPVLVLALLAWNVQWRRRRPARAASPRVAHGGEAATEIS